MKQLEMKEELLFDDLVLTDKEMFLVRGGRSYDTGRNCGNQCGNGCGNMFGNNCLSSGW